jgi:hypothetical protein
VKKPPTSIDGATVVKVADLSTASPTGRTRHIVRSEEVANFAALAIARYDSDPGFYLFYCDDGWTTITDTYHDTIEGAVAQAEFEFGHVTFTDVAA